MPLVAAFVGIAFALLLLLSASAGVVVMASHGATEKQWADWANIGQALQSIGTILAALALIGVVAALWFQARQLQVQQQELDLQQDLSRQSLAVNMRAFHVSLLKMGIENPNLLKIWSSRGNRANGKLKRLLYANLIIQHHALALETGRASEDNIRSSLHELFTIHPLFFACWAQGRTDTGLYRPGATEENFMRLVYEEYEKAAKAKASHKSGRLRRFK